VTTVRIDRVGRSFGGVRAVDDVSIDIGAGEFFTLLGPSGCGKTTLLRMVAGFCDPDRGAIHFGDRRVDTLPPHRRNTGMVFQNYAIFPNLTVAGNVAYGLKARGVAAAAATARVERALQLVHLEGFGGRWPHEMSGGQLQRVALARSLVIEPEVLLLDEPLSNLDAQLRIEMRREIRLLQQSLKITTLYVTHDQEEALAISDRIAVMRGGRLEQVAAPADLYRQPATPFVASFVGATNLLSGTVQRRENGRWRVRAAGAEFHLANGTGEVGQTVTFSLRPETLRLITAASPAPPGWAVVSARLAHVEFLGALTRLDLHLPEGDTLLRAAVLDGPLPDLAAADTVMVAYDPARVTVFPP
jgi:ABC-type Fe3+/spermidine/putrescine transport system ATPase subunit